MNEWEFTGDVVSWINETLGRNPELPFTRAKTEQRGSGSQKRRDLTLLDVNHQICLTGEIKLPYRRDGGSPFNADVVKDARKKARRAKSPYFFTWNVNEFALWDRSLWDRPWLERRVRMWRLARTLAKALFMIVRRPRRPGSGARAEGQQQILVGGGHRRQGDPVGSREKPGRRSGNSPGLDRLLR